MASKKSNKEFSRFEFETTLIGTLVKLLDNYPKLINATKEKAERKLESLGYSTKLARAIVQDCHDVAILIDEEEGGAKDRRDEEYRLYCEQWYARQCEGGNR